MALGYCVAVLELDIDITLFDLTVLIASKEAQYFIDTEKDVDATDELAFSYRNKMHNLCQSVLDKDTNVLRNLTSRQINYVSKKPESTFSAFRSFQGFDWENLWNSSMKSVLEMVASVRDNERTAYNDSVQAEKK